MATPKVQIDNSMLLKRMKRYEEVTGKQIGDTMRRGARLLAVNLAISAPPYGKNASARKLGERAVQNDILRVMRPLEKIPLTHQSATVPFKKTIQDLVTKNKQLRKDLLKAIRDNDIAKTTSIVRHVPGFSQLNVIAFPAPDLHKKTRNAYGRVRRGWKGRDIVFNSAYLGDYIKQRQARVGMTKAAWAAAALKVKADVSDALSGLPDWVKRHVGKVPAAVVDNSDAIAPKITLTNKLPWADKALRPEDQKEAIRIAREKFYKSMGIEIRYALKKAREEKA
jgi:hypothetical protein